MAKLQTQIHINAPVERVRDLTEGAARPPWMQTRPGPLVGALTESWESAEYGGGTRFVFRAEYRPRLPLLGPLVSVGYRQSVARSLTALKQMAER